jgi:hypothetical protein
MSRTCPQTRHLRRAPPRALATLALALLVASAAGCQSDPASTTRLGFATPDLAARPRAAYHVAPRTCDDQPFDETYQLVPIETCVNHPGVEKADCNTTVTCLGPEDCTDHPFGRCLGIDFSACIYRDGTQSSDPCQDDTTCTLSAGGTCRKTFAVLGCQYESQCSQNADCDPGHRCACDGNGDLTCIAATCLGDADCGVGNRCRQSRSCTGNLSGAFSCTTAQDLCASDADCPADGGLRACDNVAGRWECTFFVPCILP